MRDGLKADSNVADAKCRPGCKMGMQGVNKGDRG